jgi:hypothetical protein
MGDFLRHHASEIWSFVAGLIGGGAGGSLLTLRISRRKQVTGHGTMVDQSGSRASGDIVGRDKTVTDGRRR